MKVKTIQQFQVEGTIKKQRAVTEVVECEKKEAFDIFIRQVGICIIEKRKRKGEVYRAVVILEDENSKTIEIQRI